MNFTKISMIIAVILLTVTIPISICMEYYLHAFTTCLWIFICICAYNTELLLSDATHVIHLQNNEILKLKELIDQIEQISEEQHTRKNAFIEKACDFIKANIDHYIGHYLNDDDTYLDDSFIEDFKTFMKGDEV